MFRFLRDGLTGIAFAILLMPFNDALAISTENRNHARLKQVVETVGVIRYFHPHEAVTVVDWNRVLNDGFELALGAEDDAAFSESLARMLGSIGSGIMHNPDEQPYGLSCASSERLVRWVHEGLDVPPAVRLQGPYSSYRIGTHAQQINPRAYAILAMRIDAEDWHGEQFLFEGEARMADGGEAALWIRVDDADGEVLAFENMNERRFSGPDWQSRELIVSVDDRAESINMGLVVYGDVSAEFRQMRLHVYDQRERQAMDDSLLPASDQWTFTPVMAEFGLDSDETGDGVAVSITAPADSYLPDQQLLEQLDQAPTNWAIELVDGSTLQIPIALCPAQAELDVPARERLLAQFPPFRMDTLSVAEQSRLDLATLWPVMQHFYPYRDKMAGWSDALARAFEQLEAVDGRTDHRQLLQRLLAEVEDGHVNVRETDAEMVEDTAWLPISVLKLGGNLVITSVELDNADIAVGDRIVTIDGEPAADWLEKTLALYSGSTHWRTHRAIRDLLQGAPDSDRSFQLDRDGQMVEAHLRFEHDRQLVLYDPGYAPSMPDGIVYVDLRGLDNEQWAERLPGLLDARGVVFDLRGYPGAAGFTMLGNLLASNDDFTGWMQVLTPRAPDGDLVTAATFEWSLVPNEPRIDAPVVFLTDQRAISYAESVLGMVKYHQLGTIIGSNTAGANGNVIPLMLPGGFTVLYTGMRVYGPDGEIFHAHGIEPDVRALPTSESVREGRDEVLERALKYLGEVIQ